MNKKLLTIALLFSTILSSSCFGWGLGKWLTPNAPIQCFDETIQPNTRLEWYRVPVTGTVRDLKKSIKYHKNYRNVKLFFFHYEKYKGRSEDEAHYVCKPEELEDEWTIKWLFNEQRKTKHPPSVIIMVGSFNPVHYNYFSYPTNKVLNETRQK